MSEDKSPKQQLKDELPKRYTDPELFSKKERSVSYYEKGQIIEAFALLYAVIEQQLITIFQVKVKTELGLKLWDNAKFKHEWEYPQLIRVLNELNILTDDEYQKFKQFQDGRHKAVHQLPMPHLHKKISTATLRASFNSGKKAYEIANQKWEETTFNIVNKMTKREARKAIEDIFESQGIDYKNPPRQLFKDRKNITRRKVTIMTSKNNNRYVPTGS